MKYANRSLIFFFLILTASCSKKETEVEKEAFSQIQGSWALYEVGRLTATGIEVTPISTDGPVQGLTFNSDGRLYKNGKDMEGHFDAPFYHIDTLQDSLQIQFLTERRGKLISSARFSIEDHRMTMFPSCADSCYFKFGRLGQL